MFLEKFSLFQVNFIAAAIVSAVLSLLGVQLANRNKSSYTLAMSQMGSLGIAIGILVWTHFLSFYVHEFWKSVYVFTLGAIFSVLCYWLLEKLSAVFKSSMDLCSVSLYAIALALVSILVGIFAELETHQVLNFMGDVVLANASECASIAFLAAFCFLLVSVFLKRIEVNGFQLSIFGHILPQNKKYESILIMAIAFLLPASISVFGLLFTLSQMYLPIFVLKLFNLSRKAFVLVSMSSSICGCISGALVSLSIESLPAVPVIVVATLLYSTIAGVLVSLSTRLSCTLNKCPLETKVSCVQKN
jgi:ABC-type Mn2+/Zn2+ transport system permease subunit